MAHRAMTMTVAGAMALAVSVGAAQAQQFKWDMPNEYQATSITGLADQDFAKLVEDGSKGAIKMTLHFGGSLGYKSKDHFDAVADGAVPIADTYTGVFVGIDPVFTLSNMPFLAPSFKEVRTLIDVVRPYYNDVFKKSNQFIVFIAPWTPTGLWAKKAVATRDDLANMKIRAYDPTGVKVFKTMGAAPIQLSWADVIPQLSTGGIDAVLTSDEGGVSAKFWEHLSYFNNMNFSLGYNQTHMNQKVFASLPAGLQKVVVDSGKAAEDKAWARSETRLEENKKAMTAQKVTFTDVPRPLIIQLQEASKPVLDEWKEKMGPKGTEILNKYYKAVGRSS